MFAGRYLWWMLTGIALLLFFAICFDYFTWLAVQLSNCVEMAGSCMPVVQLMSGTLKHLGVWSTICILLAAAILRLGYLSLLWPWGPLLALWFAASTPFVLFIATGGRLQWTAVIETLPPALLFLAALLAYLAIPFEEDDSRPFGIFPVLRGAIHATAVYGALAAITEMDWLSWMMAKILGMPELASVVAAIQPRLQEVLTLGVDGIVPDVVALAVFILALIVSLLPPRLVPRLSRKRIKLRQLRH